MVATVTAIDTTVELAAPTNLLNPPRFSPVVVTPEMFTLLVTVATPALILSRCPVPSINKSLNLSDDEPKSLASSVEGTMSLSNLPVAVIVSEEASPRFTLPCASNPPVISTPPPTYKFFATPTPPSTFNAPDVALVD